MSSRYSIFNIYSTAAAYASRYQEDAIQLLLLIQGLQPGIHITFTQLDAALVQTGLSPRLLYEHASAGRYTPAMARLDAALGLPVKDVTGVEEATSALADISGLSSDECLRVMQQLIDKVPSAQVPTPLAKPTKATQKAPYYQKNKGKWWK